MPEVFRWTPQRSYSVTREPNVSVVKLGDGYEQRQAKGINTLLDSYTLVFKGSSAGCGDGGNVAIQAEAFLRARGAVEAFYWTPSMDNVQRLFVCRSWSMTKDGPVYTLNATFEQVVG
ncbi:phage tail protein [Escherichia coli]|uniref:phage tail protein n=1 Tax=Escherichia TaxID=561 RepID=UPI000A3C0C51|nr:phage tail protein [Escherichia coli]AVU66230.1 phage tail protein [Escherichia coli]MBX8663827.1 phage tail protein [Escherichia coli]MCA4877671.1 phage tail protein [Escherichia coli]MDC9168387.1 phage tail protein [Escherichia coli]MDC9182590.1 phage tail protein [Escherichia coli]